MLKNSGKIAAFIGLSCVSIGSLFASFAGDLESWEVYKMPSVNRFGQDSSEVFIFNDKSEIPFGFDRQKAKLIASNYRPGTIQKLLLLTIAGVSSTTALLLANIDFDELEISAQERKINLQAEKESRINRVKQKWALSSLAEKELFREELKALLELTGGDETMLADEVNATDKFTNAMYMLGDGHSVEFAVQQTWGVQPDNPEFNNIKSNFEKFMNGDEVNE